MPTGIERGDEGGEGASVRPAHGPPTRVRRARPPAPAEARPRPQRRAPAAGTGRPLAPTGCGTRRGRASPPPAAKREKRDVERSEEKLRWGARGWAAEITHPTRHAPHDPIRATFHLSVSLSVCPHARTMCTDTSAQDTSASSAAHAVANAPGAVAGGPFAALKREREEGSGEEDGDGVGAGRAEAWHA